jgi:HAD superfamily hydrolase (TIGR01490 family)
MIQTLPPEAGRGIAVFDFDDTLVEGDSLPRFLAAVAGAGRMRLAVAAAVTGASLAHVRGHAPGADWKGSVKALLLARTLAGVTVDEARAAAAELARRLRWKRPVLEALHRHAESGVQIVVASGALDVYLPTLLAGLPVHAVYATPAEVREGRLTGRLAGENCVRAAKARTVTGHFAAHPGHGPTWGYGNRPSDLPMLALVDHPTVV